MTITGPELAEIRDLYFEPKGEWAENRIDRVMQAAQIAAGDRVLDVGCSAGSFSFHAKRRGAEPVGLDRDWNQLDLGRQAGHIVANVELTFVCGDALQLPFASGSFDAVINADFIEHTPDESKVPIFREMFRILKPGGRGVVYTPNLARIEWELFGEKIKRLVGLRRNNVPRWQEFVDPDHFGLTTPGVTERRLRSVGFNTRMIYFEHHIPLISSAPGVGRLFSGLLPNQFAARFLVQVRKPL